MKCRAVLDTNVIVAALSSKRGASHALVRRAFDGDFVLLASPPLWLEFESVLKRSEIRQRHQFTTAEIDSFLDTLAMGVEPVRLHYLWRPQLRDPKDEMVLETAINGRADALVTFNITDFEPAMALFTPRLMTPARFLFWMEEERP